MKIEHVALWTRDLERMRAFYVQYFGAVASERYQSRTHAFASYFLTFPEGGARMELMEKPGLAESSGADIATGYAHLAISVGDEVRVQEITERLRIAGVRVAGEPRRTGDGYYESVVLNPEGNRIEITV